MTSTSLGDDVHFPQRLTLTKVVSSVVNKFNPFDLISDPDASQEEASKKQKIAQKEQGKPGGSHKASIATAPAREAPSVAPAGPALSRKVLQNPDPLSHQKVNHNPETGSSAFRASPRLPYCTRQNCQFQRRCI